MVAGSSAIAPDALANTAKVGESPSSINTLTGSALGTVGLIHTDVSGSVWHKLKFIGNATAPVSALTLIVAPEPTLIVAAVKKPLSLTSDITPLLVVVATSAMRSGTGAVEADSNNVLRPTTLAASLAFAHWNASSTSVVKNSSPGVIPITND